MKSSLTDPRSPLQSLASGKIIGAILALNGALATLAGCGGAAASTTVVTPTITATAAPASIAAGQSSMLSWDAANATAVSINQGIGNVAVSGSMTVSPSSTTTYTFTAMGATQSVTTNLTINVAPSAPSPTPIPAPTPTPAPTPSPTPSAVNVATFHMDNARSGLNDQETQLTPANVNAATFGKLFSYPVDGYMYAEPLYISDLMIQGASHNVVFAATENDSVYAFDADNFGSGAPLWKVSLLGTGEIPQPGGNPMPNQGLTSTPAIDVNSQTMYVVTAQKSSNSSPFFRLHALDITTGAERTGSPVIVQATVPGSNAESVNGKISLTSACLQRAALLLSQGTLYIGFGGCPNGWLLSYDEVTLSQIAALNMSPIADGYGKFGGAGGVWMGGGGPASDDQGNIYLSTGNGPYDGNMEWGDSVLRVNSQLQVLDHFTPSDFNFLECNDLDLAGGGVMLIPGQSMIVAGGKSGEMFLLNAEDLGGEQANDAGALQASFLSSTLTGTCVDNHGDDLTGLEGKSSIYGTSTWFNGSLYIGSDPGPLQQFTLNNGQAAAGPTSPESIAAFSYGTTAFVSANGAQNGIVWMLDHGQPIQDPLSNVPASATLRAFNAANIGTELYDSSQNPADTPGFGIKFTSPIVANGKVFIGTAHDALSIANPQGELDVFGLRN